MIHKRLFSAISDLISDRSEQIVLNGAFTPMTRGVIPSSARRPVVMGTMPMLETSPVLTHPDPPAAWTLPTIPPGVFDRGCDILPPGIARDICKGIGGTSSPTTPIPTPGQQIPPCPPGTRRIPGTNKCVDLSAFPPGGEPFIVGAGGEAVVGGFGVPGITPSVVGNISRNDGSTGPILRCPGGMALARDNICYVRSLIPKDFRKWRPGMKPLLTGGDRKILRRANTLRGKVKTLATATGFSCKKK